MTTLTTTSDTGGDFTLSVTGGFAAPATNQLLAPRRVFRLDDLEIRKAQSGRSDNYTLRGHAAVFNSLSEDLGGFRELIEPGAFRASLRGTPDLHLLFNHNPDRVLARTTASVDGKPSLELREDATGLHVWAVIKPRSWVDDLAVEMADGLIDQMSFAFTLREDGDDWAVAEDGTVIRTIRPDGFDRLYDVSVVTQPAYPATAVGMRELRTAVDRGRLPATVLGESASTDATAPDDDLVAGDHDPPQDESLVGDTATRTVFELKTETRKATEAMRARHLEALKEMRK